MTMMNLFSHFGNAHLFPVAPDDFIVRFSRLKLLKS